MFHNDYPREKKKKKILEPPLPSSPSQIDSKSQNLCKLSA